MRVIRFSECEICLLVPDRGNECVTAAEGPFNITINNNNITIKKRQDNKKLRRRARAEIEIALYIICKYINSVIITSVGSVLLLTVKIIQFV